MNEIYHNYIVRVVVFALFTFKRQIRQPNVYKISVIAFTIKRLPWKINLVIDTGLKLDKEDEREILLNELLEGIETDYLSTVVVTFVTPLKEVTMSIDLSDEEKYEHYLYS
ncbi:MAG: hypothetical protein ACR2JI_11105 [Mycobacterium sp.]